MPASDALVSPSLLPPAASRANRSSLLAVLVDEHSGAGERVWARIKIPVYTLVGAGLCLAAFDEPHRPLYLLGVWTIFLLPIVVTNAWDGLFGLRGRGTIFGFFLGHFVLLAYLYALLTQQLYLLAAVGAVVEFGLSLLVQGQLLSHRRPVAASLPLAPNRSIANQSVADLMSLPIDADRAPASADLSKS